jgi:hypothetical protein
MIKHLILICFAILTPIAAVATPSPAVVTQDQLIGVNDRSFFVLRTTTIYPGSYYQVTHRLEFIELSIWDGSRRGGCLIRETISQDETADGDWKHIDTELSTCDVSTRLRDAGAHFLPLSLSYHSPAVSYWKLGSGGVYRAGEGPKLILGWDYIDSRARAMNVVEDVKFAWNSELFTLCPYCEYVGKELSLDDECRLLPDRPKSNFADWVFLHFTCWSGDGDISGASFYIPVSLKTYYEGYRE